MSEFGRLHPEVGGDSDGLRGRPPVRSALKKTPENRSGASSSRVQQGGRPHSSPPPKDAQPAPEDPGTHRRTRSQSRARGAGGTSSQAKTAVAPSAPTAPDRKGKRKAPPDSADIGTQVETAVAPSAPTAPDRKGKRKAPPESADIGTQVDPKRARAELNLPAEEVRWEWLPHPTPCEACNQSGGPCLCCPLATSSCQACHKKKVKCSLTVSGVKSLVASYLAWAFWRMTVRPEEYGPPPFKLNNPPVNGTIVPSWYKTRYNEFTAGQRSQGPPLPDKVPPAHHPAKSNRTSAAAQRAPRARGRVSVRGGRPAASSARSRSPQASPVTSRTNSRGAPSASGASLPPPSPVDRSTNSPRSSESPQVARTGGLFDMDVDAEGDHTFDLQEMYMAVPGPSEYDGDDAVSVGGDGGDGESSGGWGGASQISDGDVDEGEAAGDVEMDSMAGSPPAGSYYAQRKRKLPAPSVEAQEPPPHMTTIERTSKLPAELVRATASRAAFKARAPMQMRAASPVEGYDEVMPLKGSWQDLPWLSSLDGEPSTWAPTTLLPLAAPSGRSANPLSPPGTPPSRVFTIGGHTLATLDDARAHVQAVDPIVSEADVRVSALRRLEDRARIRRRNAIHAAANTTSIAEALEGLYSQLQQSEGDLAEATSLLAAMAGDQGAIARTFRYVPTVPVGTATLVEMVEVLGRLEALYHEMWKRYEVVQQDMRPLRETVTALGQSRQAIEDRLDGIPYETAGALHPDLAKVEARLLAEVTAMHSVVSAALKELRDSLAHSGAVSKTLTTSVREALETTAEAVAECMENVSLNMRTSAVTAETVAYKYADLEGRISRLEGDAPSPPQPEVPSIGPPPTPGSSDGALEAINTLGERVRILETEFDSRVEGAVAKGIKAYLEQFGLGEHALKRLGDPMTQSRLTWGSVTSSSGQVSPDVTSVGFSFGMQPGPPM
ncbi:hypothetical protein LXA43DRAFT_1091123 [Ganoderma leucocontextum]|nr:hypothetical protein LXA43DRAFT_1098546 [Ganoderma leucocontextum]KAI1795474.1 hypothetical protein LXA43DRAFT_1091123 [Ganoderma leucocontextum]